MAGEVEIAEGGGAEEAESKSSSAIVLGGYIYISTYICWKLKRNLARLVHNFTSYSSYSLCFLDYYYLLIDFSGFFPLNFCHDSCVSASNVSNWMKPGYVFF